MEAGNLRKKKKFDDKIEESKGTLAKA